MNAQTCKIISNNEKEKNALYFLREYVAKSLSGMRKYCIATYEFSYRLC